MSRRLQDALPSDRVQVIRLTYPSDTGALMVLICEECKRVEITWSAQAPRPENGDDGWVVRFVGATDCACFARPLRMYDLDLDSYC